jgi:ribosomal protein L3 glutamine methyltransferase
MTIILEKINTINELITHGEQLFDAAELYFGHGTDNSADEAAYIVLFLTNNLPIPENINTDVRVSVNEKKKIIDVFNRRINEKTPAAYLLGEAWFVGMPFIVSEDVLVPRSPFAELIGDQFSPWVNVNKVHNILDLCTGSGCIGIGCATFFPDATVDLADISEKALSIAKRNIEKHDLSNRVSTVQSDLYGGLNDKSYDLIVCNPPYVGHDELSSLPDEFYKEPQIGLDGGVSGLDLVHNILAGASDYLNDGGFLYVEVGNTDEVLQECYPSVPFLWQEFEYGGHGVFMLTKQQLIEYKNLFQAKLI